MPLQCGTVNVLCSLYNLVYLSQIYKSAAFYTTCTVRNFEYINFISCMPRQLLPQHASWCWLHAEVTLSSTHFNLAIIPTRHLCLSFHSWRRGHSTFWHLSPFSFLSPSHYISLSPSLIWWHAVLLHIYISAMLHLTIPII